MKSIKYLLLIQEHYTLTYCWNTVVNTLEINIFKVAATFYFTEWHTSLECSLFWRSLEQLYRMTFRHYLLSSQFFG
jgi:hypothetical protein